MANQVPTIPEPGFSSLLRGIVNDIGDLIKQQIQFAQAEIKADIRKSKEAGAFLTLGLGSAFIGMLLLSLMMVHLLHWLTVPTGMDPASFPLWGCYGVVAVLFLITGAGLFVTGQRMFASFTPLPEQTVQTVKENVEWITNSK